MMNCSNSHTMILIGKSKHFCKEEVLDVMFGFFFISINLSNFKSFLSLFSNPDIDQFKPFLCLLNIIFASSSQFSLKCYESKCTLNSQSQTNSISIEFSCVSSDALPVPGTEEDASRLDCPLPAWTHETAPENGSLPHFL